MVRGLQVLAFAALLAVLLAVVAWMLEGAHTDAVSPPQQPVAASATVAIAEGVVVPDPGKQSEETEPRRIEVSGGGAAVGMTAPSVQVRVLGPDGKALAGVTVRYYGAFAAPRLDAAARLEFDHLHYDREAQLLRFGTAVVTDANGIARWPWVAADRTSWSVGARHGDDWGEDWINANAAATEVHDLQLWPDQSFAVRVLDAQQQPAEAVGIEAVYLQAADGGRPSPGPRPRTGVLAVTDAGGVARVTHLQTWARSVAARGSARPATIQPSLPGVDVGQEIDTALPPREPVVLHLPPTGAIRISLRDATGAAASGSRISMVEEPRPAELRSFDASTDGRGVAMYARVGLSRQWRLYLTLAGMPAQKVIEGPRHAGEVVEIELAPDPAPLLRGQLLFDDKPAAGVGFIMQADGRGLMSGIAHTDMEGRFVVGATYGKWVDATIRGLQFRSYDDRGSPDGRVGSWQGELTSTLGEHDLGTVELRQQPVVVAGRLQVRTGTLAAGQRIWVEAATGEADRPWQYVSLDQQLQQDGSFAFFGTAPSAALRLRVDTRCEYLPVAPVPFVAGARDLVVALERGGSVRASVVVGTVIAGWNLVPELRPMTAAAHPAGIMRFAPGSDPSVPLQRGVMNAKPPVEIGYTWPAVVPGRYRLLVRARGVRVPLVEIDDVVVTDGECNSEDRLQHVQVPGLKAITLQLPQAESLLAGQPAAGSGGAGVVFVLEGDTPTDQCVQVDGMVLLSATRPLDLLVRLHGCRDKVLRSVFEDQTVTLDPGIAVTIEATGIEVPAGAKLQCTLTPLDDALTAAHSSPYSAVAGGSLANYRSPPADAAFADGRAQFAVNAPGRYRCSAQLVGADGVPQAVEVTPAEVTIGDGGGSFAVRMRLPK